MTLSFEPGQTGGDLIKDSSDARFAQDVIEASRKQPVLVDFWAPWCGPCRQLTPILEKQVRAAKGKLKLVKINIDENPGVAGQLGVRSIPAVFAFDGGRPVDGFMGALPESQIKMFIDRLGGGGDTGADVEALLAQSQEALGLGDLGGAAQGFAAALQLDPENVKAVAGLARSYLASGDLSRARELIEMVPADKAGDSEVAGVKAALAFAADAQNSGDPRALARTVEADPVDHQARFDLASALAARGQLDEACEHLMAILQADRAWNEEAARKLLLRIFEAAGPASALARSGRRRLSALLFS